MRIVLKSIFLLFSALTISLSTYAQMDRLFAPFDCRRHAELDIEKTITDTLSQVSIQALQVVEVPAPVIEIDTADAWKKWKTVENFTYGKDRGTMPMIIELDALHPYFRDRIVDLINTCEAQGIHLAVVESYRTYAKQHEYKSMGKKYTRSGAGKSKHQYGLAVDVVPIVDSIAMWDDKNLWKRIGIIGEHLGLRWGGRWRTPYDPGHFEWTGGISTAELSIGKLPPIVNKDSYPCIEEDVKLLRKYWKEWEDEVQKSYARN